MHRRRRYVAVILAVLGSSLTVQPVHAEHYDDFPPSQERPRVVDVDVVIPDGARNDTHTFPEKVTTPDGTTLPTGTTLVAFDRLGEDGFYDVWLLDLHTGSEWCITCDEEVLGLPSGHKGQPAWHPSGDWLVIQVEKEEHPGGQGNFFTHPGIGIYNDLWMTRTDGSSAHRIYETDPQGRDGKGRGALHPHFDADGDRLVVSDYRSGPAAGPFAEPMERVEALTRLPNRVSGEWKVLVGNIDFDSNNTPSLTGVERYQPGEPGLYETHGFSPDGMGVLMSANPDPNQLAPGGIDIVVMGLEDEEEGNIVRRVTESRLEWDEHAHYPPTTSDRQGRLLFASNHGLSLTPQYPFPAVYGAFAGPIGELWVSEPNGAIWRLTDFNNPEWEHRPEREKALPLPIEDKIFPADFSYVDGKTIVALLIVKGVGPVSTHERIVRIRLSDPL